MKHTGINRHNKAKYHYVNNFEYKNGVFAAGLVKNSIHKANTVFLQIRDCVFDLRADEANAIISSLAESLWTNYHLTPTAKKKVPWKSIEEILPPTGIK